MQEQLYKIKVNAKQHIALWKLSSKAQPTYKNIFLTHGTFSNKKVCMGIAKFMTNKGYTCWIMEWRNHGASSPFNQKFNFETIGKEDIQLSLRFLFKKMKIKNLSCITHSGGGICLSITLMDNPEFRPKINSISLFGCQAFGAGDNNWNFMKIWFGKQTARLLRRVPASKIGSEHNESYHTMKQWFDWNLSKQFVGSDGTDYRSQMPEIDIPILSICGAGDTFIAPRTGCENFLTAFQNPANELLFCSKELGFKEDYNHPRILHSRNASEEIYPMVFDWVCKHED